MLQATTETLGYMVEHTSGVVCIAMEGKDLDRLRLPLMISTAENEEAMTTAFTVTVDLKEGTTTGAASGKCSVSVSVWLGTCLGLACVSSCVATRAKTR